jgi:hypothetical protein
MVGKAVRYPSLLASVLNRRWTRTTVGHENPAGISVFDRDWDVLGILDACRFDFFEAECTLPGELEAVQSKGSATPEWMRTNFTGRDLTDTVYVSANPWYSQLRDELDCTFHRYVEVTRTEDDYAPFPDAVTERALELSEEFSNKRLLVHYMQPHRPYQSDWVRSRPGFDRSGGFQQWVRTNGFSKDEVRNGYRENVKLVMDSVETLVESIEGRTVISADHGELLGDRMSPIPLRRYGHPRGVYIPELVRVPWLVHERGERRTVTKDAPTETVASDGDVAERLEKLGYV